MCRFYDPRAFNDNNLNELVNTRREMPLIEQLTKSEKPFNRQFIIDHS